MVENIAKHFKLITEHKILVFKLCTKAGIPYRGFMHDWSKYSPTEFIESVKYFTGTHSPILECREKNGYSEAWLHHKGRNKHHYEYWIDNNSTERIPVIIPYEYSLEMCCDMLAAGMIYKKDSWTKEYPLSYWLERKDFLEMHPVNKKFLTVVFTLVSKYGIDILNKKVTKKIYLKCKKEFLNA